MDEALDRLARWYAAHCDGDWEHSFGITIESLDNPGWAVRVDLRLTELEERPLPREEFHRSADDWLIRTVEDGQYRAFCGPLNLGEALSGFLAWAK